MDLRVAGKGFTIVELLIVIAVIAILATISIVAYTGIQGRARPSSAHTAASNSIKKIELYYVDYGSYPSAPSILTGAAATDTLGLMAFLLSATTLQALAILQLLFSNGAVSERLEIIQLLLPYQRWRLSPVLESAIGVGKKILFAG